METLEEQLKKAEALEAELHIQAREATERVQQLHRKIAERDFGVKAGSVVKNRGRVYRVADVESYGYGRPTVYGHQRKKDGEFGARRVYVGSNWELVHAE